MFIASCKRGEMAVNTDMETGLTLETVAKNSERIAKLEAGYEHLATKADIEKLRADITWRIVLAMSVLTGVFAVIVRLPA